MAILLHVSPNPPHVEVEPHSLSLVENTGFETLVWRPEEGLTITGIVFADGAPISGLSENPTTGDWTGQWDTEQGGSWSYTVQAEHQGTVLIAEDPEVENEPPSG